MNPIDRLRQFARRTAAAVLPALRRRERFTQTYLENYWRGAESRSGTGSSLDQTAAVRAALPGLCRDFGVRSLLDLPCGDFHWMREVALPGVDYIGADIVVPLIEDNRRRHAAPGRRFIVHDLVAEPPPRVDLVLCRDLLVHLGEADIQRAIANLKRSGSGLLLTTSFDARGHNPDLVGIDWRPLNLQRPPFGFPLPLRRIDEHCTEGGGAYADKGLCLWRITDLP